MNRTAFGFLLEPTCMWMLGGKQQRGFCGMLENACNSVNVKTSPHFHFKVALWIFLPSSNLLSEVSPVSHAGAKCCWEYFCSIFTAQENSWEPPRLPEFPCCFVFDEFRFQLHIFSAEGQSRCRSLSGHFCSSTCCACFQTVGANQTWSTPEGDYANTLDRKPKSLDSNPDLLLHLICLQIENQPSAISQRTSLIPSSARPGGGDNPPTSPLDLEIINTVTAAFSSLFIFFLSFTGFSWTSRFFKSWRSSGECGRSDQVFYRKCGNL